MSRVGIRPSELSASQYLRVYAGNARITDLRHWGDDAWHDNVVRSVLHARNLHGARVTENVRCGWKRVDRVFLNSGGRRIFWPANFPEFPRIAW
jgi:hypothetical protein